MALPVQWLSGKIGAGVEAGKKGVAQGLGADEIKQSVRDAVQQSMYAPVQNLGGMIQQAQQYAQQQQQPQYQMAQTVSPAGSVSGSFGEGEEKSSAFKSSEGGKAKEHKRSPWHQALDDYFGKEGLGGIANDLLSYSTPVLIADTFAPEWAFNPASKEEIAESYANGPLEFNGDYSMPSGEALESLSPEQRQEWQNETTQGLLNSAALGLSFLPIGESIAASPIVRELGVSPKNMARTKQVKANAVKKGTMPNLEPAGAQGGRSIANELAAAVEEAAPKIASDETKKRGFRGFLDSLKQSRKAAPETGVNPAPVVEAEAEAAKAAAKPAAAIAEDEAKTAGTLREALEKQGIKLPGSSGKPAYEGPLYTKPNPNLQGFPASVADLPGPLSKKISDAEEAFLTDFLPKIGEENLKKASPGPLKQGAKTVGSFLVPGFLGGSLGQVVTGLALNDKEKRDSAGVENTLKSLEEIISHGRTNTADAADTTSVDPMLDETGYSANQLIDLYYNWIAYEAAGQEFARRFGQYANPEDYGYTRLRASYDRDAFEYLLNNFPEFYNRYLAAGYDISDPETMLENFLARYYGDDAVDPVEWQLNQVGNLGYGHSLNEASDYLNNFYDWANFSQYGLDWRDARILSLINNTYANGIDPGMTLDYLDSLWADSGDHGHWAFVDEDSDEYKNRGRRDIRAYNPQDMYAIMQELQNAAGDMSKAPSIYTGWDKNNPIYSQASDTFQELYNAKSGGKRKLIWKN